MPGSLDVALQTEAGLHDVRIQVQPIEVRQLISKNLTIGLCEALVGFHDCLIGYAYRGWIE